MASRGYQTKLKHDIYDDWGAGYKNVLAVLPTGGGKTRMFTDIVNEFDGYACAIAHRKELVSQISLAFTGAGVKHRIIAPSSTVRDIVQLQQQIHGRVSYSTSAHVAVAGVDTILNRQSELSRFIPRVGLWVQDEAHHVLKSNKWGKAAALFPTARGLGVTATPLRADGKILGVNNDGLFESMRQGPGMRDLINSGYLTDYRIYAPPSDLDINGVKITGTGDFSGKQLQQRVRQSHLVGDIIQHYLKLAPGKLGVTFVTSVDTAVEVAARFNAAGVPAAVIDANTPVRERFNILQRFRRRELLQLVNVDLFGEGFDLPAIEVVIMARPTQSYQLYVQQFGRVLRLLLPENIMGEWENFTPEQRLHLIAQSDKPRGIIIDPVGNCLRHGLPDTPRVWDIHTPPKKRKQRDPDEIKLESCTNIECLAVYEFYRTKCPFCGVQSVPAERSQPEFVDGDLAELNPATLDKLRAEITRIDSPPQIPQHVDSVVAMAIRKNHHARQEAQTELRHAMSVWGGAYESLGYTHRESHKLFYGRFGVDVLTAQTLNRADATELYVRVFNHLTDLQKKHNLLLPGDHENDITGMGQSLGATG